MAIALWALYISLFVPLLPQEYHELGIILGTAILALFLVYFNKRLDMSEMERSLSQAIEDLDIDDDTKERLYREMREFFSSKKRGVYVRIFKIKIPHIQNKGDFT